MDYRIGILVIQNITPVFLLLPLMSEDPKQENTAPDYYFENGLMVMTESYHLKRGYCCGNKCKHCPYQHEAVPTDES